MGRTGLLLEPNLHSTWTQLKLVLVLVVGFEGLLATWLHPSFRLAHHNVCLWHR